MINEKAEFVDALDRFIQSELRHSSEPADYNTESIEIVDARNHLFRNVGNKGTDEELGFFAIRDLCHLDEDTMEFVPNRMRLAAIAREYGLE